MYSHEHKTFLLLIVMLVTIILGVIAILLITGTFTAGLDEKETLFQNELLHTSEKISMQYGELSVQVIEFSGNYHVILKKNRKS